MQRSIPEDEGLPSAALAAFVNRFFSLEWTHGLVVLRHGRVVAEAYRRPCSPADRHQMFSLSKSFASTAMGIALGEGLVKSLDEPVVSFFPEFDSPRVTERMRRTTLRHLLTMSSGRNACGLWGERYATLLEEFDRDHGDDMRAVAERFASGREYFGNDRSFVQNLLEDELPLEPGTQFVYDTSATLLVGAVVRKVSGMRLSDYLRDRLFRPLGIPDEATWDRTPDGEDFAGIGLNLTVREIAAAGQLWLRGGVLPDGRRLVPAEYLAEATSRQIDNDAPGRNPDWCQGYGFQFWRCRHGAFRADGAAGQLCVMLPDQDAVVAATAGVTNMQRELDAIWEDLLPAFRATPLPRDPAAVARLREAENSQAFDFGPVGASNPAFPMGDVQRLSAGRNVYGVAGITVEQDAGGVSIGLLFGDGHVDELRAGWDAPRTSLLCRLAQGHTFETFARARWTSPEALEVTVAVPRSTSFLNLALDLGHGILRCHANIWFAHPRLANAEIPLSPVP